MLDGLSWRRLSCGTAWPWSRSFAAVGPRRGQRVHVLDPYWTRGWAAEELAGRRLPASPEQLEEEERDNVYDKAGFLSFMEFGGFDFRQDGAMRQRSVTRVLIL